MFTLTSLRLYPLHSQAPLKISSRSCCFARLLSASKLTSYGRTTRELPALTIQQGLSGSCLTGLEFSFPVSVFSLFFRWKAQK